MDDSDAIAGLEASDLALGTSGLESVHELLDQASSTHDSLAWIAGDLVDVPVLLLTLAVAVISTRDIAVLASDHAAGTVERNAICRRLVSAMTAATFSLLWKMSSSVASFVRAASTSKTHVYISIVVSAGDPLVVAKLSCLDGLSRELVRSFLHGQMSDTAPEVDASDLVDAGELEIGQAHGHGARVLCRSARREESVIDPSSGALAKRKSRLLKSGVVFVATDLEELIMLVGAREPRVELRKGGHGVDMTGT